MTQIITGLLDASTWETIFLSFFFFGLFFFILAIISSFGDDDADVDSDADGELIDLDGDGIGDGIDLDGDGIIDVDLDSDLDISSGTVIDLDGDGIGDGIDFDGDGIIDMDIDSDLSLDTDLDTDVEVGIDGDLDTDVDGEMGDDPFNHIEISSFDVDKGDDRDFIFFDSKYKVGEYASFSMFYGMTGWYYSASITDFQLILAIFIGFVAMKSFAFVIANYTQTVTVPVKETRRGDIAQVRYNVTPEKAGLITIFRKDGVLSTEMAKGAFPHDFFSKGEKGYVWGKTEKGLYLITRGIIGQPDLNTKESKSTVKAMDPIKPENNQKKKAMDINY